MRIPRAPPVATAQSIVSTYEGVYQQDPVLGCVPNCNGNYRKGPRVSIFLFPRDKVLASQWLRSIKRDNFSPTASTRAPTPTSVYHRALGAAAASLLLVHPPGSVPPPGASQSPSLLEGLGITTFNCFIHGRLLGQSVCSSLPVMPTGRRPM
ncbi:hypothetical protein GWK47_031179 [Chionoecetes opilio]|uniref:THAP-type domain-containing protein n=1 Tax=Chionoecetes opilio TaxID=41210 RepID=A0A8J4YKH7_CHIOP|nr:hypothetical protein GWK47_031179 [Chionoecetes opilio]